MAGSDSGTWRSGRLQERMGLTYCQPHAHTGAGDVRRSSGGPRQVQDESRRQEA